MLTAETKVDTTRKPYATPTFAGWYDPDSIVFQAADDDRFERRMPGRPNEENLRVVALAGERGPTSRR